MHAKLCEIVRDHGCLCCAHVRAGVQACVGVCASAHVCVCCVCVCVLCVCVCVCVRVCCLRAHDRTRYCFVVLYASMCVGSYV
jgi:hypothetical protein